jgi:hypothetical protein
MIADATLLRESHSIVPHNNGWQPTLLWREIGFLWMWQLL